MIAIISPETRCCSMCAEVKPLAHFRHRYKADPTKGRARECNQCHNLQERLRLEKKRLKLNGPALNQFARLLNQATRPRDIERLTAAMIHEFGGVQPLVKAWTEHIDAATEKDVGSRAVGNSITAIFRLIEHSAPEPIDMTNISTGDLQRILDDSIRRNSGETS